MPALWSGHHRKNACPLFIINSEFQGYNVDTEDRRQYKFFVAGCLLFFTLVFVTEAVRICNIQGGIFNTEGPLLHNFVRSVQRWAQRWALGCRTFLPGPAWLMLSKTGPPFSPFLYKLEGWSGPAATISYFSFFSSPAAVMAVKAKDNCNFA